MVRIECRGVPCYTLFGIEKNVIGGKIYSRCVNSTCNASREEGLQNGECLRPSVSMNIANGKNR